MALLQKDSSLPTSTNLGIHEDTSQMVAIFGDKSGSMAGNNVTLAAEIIASLVPVLVQRRTSMTLINTVPQSILQLGQHGRQDYEKALRTWKVSINGSTRIWGGIHDAAVELQKCQEQWIHLLVITDGQDNMSTGQFYGQKGITALQKALKDMSMPHTMYIVGTGQVSALDVKFFQTTVLETGGLFANVKSFDDIRRFNNTFSQHFSERLQSRYVRQARSNASSSGSIVSSHHEYRAPMVPSAQSSTDASARASEWRQNLGTCNTQYSRPPSGKDYSSGLSARDHRPPVPPPGPSYSHTVPRSNPTVHTDPGADLANTSYIYCGKSLSSVHLPRGAASPVHVQPPSQRTPKPDPREAGGDWKPSAIGADGWILDEGCKSMEVEWGKEQQSVIKDESTSREHLNDASSEAWQVISAAAELSRETIDAAAASLGGVQKKMLSMFARMQTMEEALATQKLQLENKMQEDMAAMQKEVEDKMAKQKRDMEEQMKAKLRDLEVQTAIGREKLRDEVVRDGRDQGEQEAIGKICDALEETWCSQIQGPWVLKNVIIKPGDPGRRYTVVLDNVLDADAMKPMKQFLQKSVQKSLGGGHVHIQDKTEADLVSEKNAGTSVEQGAFGM